MQQGDVNLEDKYKLNDGQIYLTGSQALVRLPLVLRRLDEAAGLNTAGFISGYRGSPLHTYDLELGRAGHLLEDHGIKFVPGVNEDLAVTAVKGSQMAGAYGDGKYDGVFGIWYGKNPGLDCSVDAMRHANLAGTSKYGGVLAIVGDDHGMRSTDTLAHCEPTFEDMYIPVLYPANLQEVLDFGVLGIALSRYCGAWVGFKIVPESVECSGIVDADINRVKIIEPDFDMPAGGVHSRALDWWFMGWGQRLTRVKMPAAVAFARANKINRVSHSSEKPRFGIVAAGKAWLDVLEALRSLGISEQLMDDLGITVYKVGMVFPHDIQGYREFAEGLEEVLVVEEKRQQMEGALKDACYGLPESSRPRIVGRYDESGEMLIDDAGELTPEIVARAIVKRIGDFYTSESIKGRLAQLEQQQAQMASLPALTLARMPYFCSGCPHNISTKAPEGSRSHGGIGCHGMAGFMERGVMDFCQMGGEGMPWIGESPFVTTKHIFQNLGEGTYFHSGSLAIRQAVAAKINITYKILFNDAVAMTGGQVVDGELSVADITHQVYAEGVRRLLVVTDEPHKYKGGQPFAEGVTVHHRRELDALQKELREYEGVSVLVYDQTCAAEKRRRRKKGEFPDPAKRFFINDRVCEGCGDCAEKSNCLSVVPVKTEFGRKRMIDQSSCNKDYSCVEGFCPSFVTVLGGKVRKGQGVGDVPFDSAQLPTPELATIPDGETYRVLIAGVGGTGVVTIGALLGMAARLEGKATTVLDQMGLAQKGGAVISHLRFANKTDDIKAVRVNTGAADLLLGCDSLVAGGDAALSAVSGDHTYAVINDNEAITGDFLRNPDMHFPADTLKARILQMVGDKCDFVEASKLATRLLGDSIASNLFLVGYTWQKGLLPVGEVALLRAIEMNGVAVEWNKQAFLWGRRAAHDLQEVIDQAEPASPVTIIDPQHTVDRFSAELVSYQNQAYANRYRALVERVKAIETQRVNGTQLSEAVARYAYKLMAYKDEYEVARLYSDPAFLKKLDEQFEGDYRLEFNLAPPLLARNDKSTGKPRKMQFGCWMIKAFGLLQHLKFLRGSAFDPFGWTAERKLERALIDGYEASISELLEGLNSDNYDLAVEITSLPEKIRGYGHVKERHMDNVKALKQKLMAKWRGEDLDTEPSLAVEVRVEEAVEETT